MFVPTFVGLFFKSKLLFLEGMLTALRETAGETTRHLYSVRSTFTNQLEDM